MSWIKTHWFSVGVLAILCVFLPTTYWQWKTIILTDQKLQDCRTILDSANGVINDLDGQISDAKSQPNDAMTLISVDDLLPLPEVDDTICDINNSSTQ
jgi:hypothetical protein